MLSLKLAEHNTATNTFRFISKDNAHFIDISEKWLIDNGYSHWLTWGSIGQSFKYGPLQLEGASGIPSTPTTQSFNSLTYVKTDVGLKIVCKDVAKATELLAAVDGMIFGKEFFNTLAVCKCQNYKLSNGGLDVDILTAIPSKVVVTEETKIRNLYSAEEVKNTVLAHLRKNGLVGSATVYDCDFSPLGLGHHFTMGKTYMISLHVKECTKAPIDNRLHFQVNAMGLNTHTRIYSNGMWFVAKDTTFYELSKGKCLEVNTGDPLPYSFAPIVDSRNTIMGERIAVLNGKAIFLLSAMSVYYAGALFKDLVDSYGIYRKILDNEIVKDIRIKGVRQGCTPLPQFTSVKGNQMVIEIPVNLSAVYFSMEQIKDTLTEMMVGDRVTDMEITSVETKKNHILFHINYAKGEV